MELNKEIEKELIEITNATSEVSGQLHTIDDTMRFLIICYYITFGYSKEKWKSWLYKNIDVEMLEFWIKESKLDLR